MAFDPLVSNAGRLRILTALAEEPRGQAFVRLRNRTGLTDGNLATHARRLQLAGFVAIHKSIDAGKPLTTIHLTDAGREALTRHARALQAALSPRETLAADEQTAVPVAAVHEQDDADDWVD
jgi:DNA-binding MarR family transcriptional regulator